ncbi:hypothetical protein V1264_004827 [Littorina saxatilis]|uniref:Protein sleepless n=1 Tax=Littorina saxatilis TaxID=31220 RepID=A0AAN9G719_9CAEN
MSSGGRTVATVLFLTGLITCCVAPMCFSCTQKDFGCNDPFTLPNTEAITCDETCVKMRGDRYSDSVPIVEVTRACIGQRDDGCYNTTYNSIFVEACACNTDYCNASPPASSAAKGALLHELHLVVSAAVCLIHNAVGR